MPFNLHTELANQGIEYINDKFTFDDSYQGSKSDEVKQSIYSIVALEKLLFATELSKPSGMKAIQRGEWKSLEHTNLIAAPLCLHSIVYQSQKSNQMVGATELDTVSEVFQKVASAMKEVVQNLSPDSKSNIADSIYNYLKSIGITSESGGKYQVINDVVEHYLTIATAPELLTKISGAYLKTIIPRVNPRILQLQSFVKPNQTAVRYPKGKEVKEIVDLKTYTPKRSRPRRSNHGQLLKSKFARITRTNSLIAERSKASDENRETQISIFEQKEGVENLEREKEQVAEILKSPSDTDMSTEVQQQEGWCILL